MSLETWEKSIKTNITSYFISLKYQLELMNKNQKGSIVNISSIAGLKAFEHPLIDYVASKHAIIGMTKDIAAHYGKFNIRANSLCPGVHQDRGEQYIMKQSRN